MKTTEIVDSLVRGKIAEMGYELDEVEYVKEYGSMVLTLYIDSENGVTIDDCEKVSRAIDPILDENDPIEEAYYLSVSSIGIDRPLKKDKDFERNMGKKLQVKLYAPINKKKELLEYIRSTNRVLYGKLRHSLMGNFMNLPGRGGRKVSVAAYKLCQKFYGFN